MHLNSPISTMDFLPQLQAIFALLAFLLFYHLLIARPKGDQNNGKGAPEPAGSLPIIGHLHLLGGHEPLPQKLAALADKYGPAFTLRLGMNRALVVSNWELAKECFTTNDKTLATRPRGAACQYMGYNYAMFGFAPYGPYWRNMRKIVTHELLSNRSINSLRHVFESEIDRFIKELYGLWVKNDRNPVKVELSRMFEDLIFNVLSMMVFGKRYFADSGVCDEGEASRFRQALHQRLRLNGVSVASDLFPFLNWIGMDLKGYKSAMKRTAKEMDSHLKHCLKEHRLKRRSGVGRGQQDFMDTMISIMEDKEISMYDPDTIIKATSLTLIVAGGDTTSVTLTWAIALLINHPHALQKAQDNLDRQIGRNEKIDHSDLSNLPYLQAIIKETMRLYPAAPLNIPHEAMEDCNVGGFHVPSGTRVLVNLWKLQRDPRVWWDPSAFKPERFLTMDLDAGQHFEFMPFGSGRRSCPGASLALQVMHLVLARLLHGFELRAPLDASIDMSEGVGLTLPKATPLEVVLVPRLPCELYMP